MVWEVVQGVGSVVGLLTGIFVLREHVTKDIPTAYFIGTPAGVAARIVNRSDRPIFVKFTNTEQEDHFRIATDDSVLAISSSIARGEAMLVLDGNEARNFPLINPPEQDGLPADHKWTMVIHWRFAQIGFWRSWRRISVATTKDSVELLEEQIVRKYPNSPAP